MHASTTCKIVFLATSEKLEAAVDYLEKLQRGEYFFDEESEDLVLTIEEDLELTGKDDVIDFIERLHKRFNKKIDLHAVGVFNAIGSDMSQKFECQCNKNFFRYRDTDWNNNIDVDEDISYEEFEEENYVDIDEDEYEEYIHRAKEGIRSNDGEMYGDWEYLD